MHAMSAFVALLTREARAAAVRRTTTLTAAEIDESVTLGIAISIVFAVAIAAVAALSAVSLVNGRRWARVTGTVVAAITAAFALLRIFAGGPAAVLSSIVLVTALVAITLLHRRPVSEFLTSTPETASP